MFCTQCGAKNNNDARFCTSCGSPLVTVPHSQQDATIKMPAPVTSEPAPTLQTAATTTKGLSKAAKMWLAAGIAVVMVGMSVLGYGYFANAGNNPVGEKLGFSHAEVVGQPTESHNNGKDDTTTEGTASSAQSQEGSIGTQAPNPNATTRAESGADSLTDSDYGKEVVSHIRSSNRELGYYTALFQDYKAQYVPNNTAESFVESAGKLKYADKYYSLTASGDTMRVERRTTIPSDEYLKYELMSDVVGEYGIPILSLAYESGVPDPKIDVALYDETNNSLVYELKNLSLKGKIEDYFFSIPGTDVNLWKEVLFPDGYTEG